MNNYEGRDFSDYADYKFDGMRDDFMMIESEQDAKDCIERYSYLAGRYMPVKYKYLLKEVLLNDQINRCN